MIGKEGLTDAVQKATDKALEDHELIKIKLPADNQDEFQEVVNSLMAVIKAEVVQTIGHQLVIYRRSKKPGKIIKSGKVMLDFDKVGLICVPIYWRGSIIFYIESF